MKLSEGERFAANSRSDEGLRREAERAGADTMPGTALSCIVAVAIGRGYGITANDERSLPSSEASADGKRFMDAELDGVSGGPNFV